MKMLPRFILAAALAAAGGLALAAGLPEVVVYKSPTCGCCGTWVDHMKANGFKVKVIDQADVDPVKTRLGVPMQLASCHTAVVGGYVIEGHVPAAAVKRLLAEKPSTLGLSVPGMVVGSPGMEGPNPQPFSTLMFDERGRTRVFESYRPPYRW